MSPYYINDVDRNNMRRIMVAEGKNSGCPK